MQRRLEIKIVGKGNVLLLTGETEEDIREELDYSDIEDTDTTDYIDISVLITPLKLGGEIEMQYKLKFNNEVSFMDALNEAFKYLNLPS